METYWIDLQYGEIYKDKSESPVVPRRRPIFLLKRKPTIFVTLSPHAVEFLATRFMSWSFLFGQVAVKPLSISETLEVARVRYPGLPPQVSKRLLDTMVTAKGGRVGGVSFSSSRKATGGREPGVRDFLKLCARVDRLGLFDSPDTQVSVSDVAGGEDGDGLERDWFCSEAQALPVIQECLDVFAGHRTTKVSLDVFGFVIHVLC